MSSLFWLEDEKKKLDMLKKYAPSIYALHCAKKVRKLTIELNELRSTYAFIKGKKEKSPEDLKRMKEIEEEGQRLNEQLSLYEVVS